MLFKGSYWDKNAIIYAGNVHIGNFSTKQVLKR